MFRPLVPTRLLISALALAVIVLMALAIPALGSGTTALSFQECFNANGGGCASNSNAGLGNADAVALSPDGKSIYVASQSDSGVVDFDRDPTTGALTDEGCYTSESSGCAVDNLPSMVDAQGVAVSPDGKSVYVTSFSEGSVDHFERNTETGELTYKDCMSSRSSGCGAGDNVPGLSGAWGVTVSPDGKSVYVAANIREALVSFGRDETTGSLTDEGCLAVHEVGCGAGNDAAPGLVGPIDVAVSPNGANVYVASGVPGTLGSLSTFDRAAGGALTAAGCLATGLSACGPEVAGLEGAAGVALSPDGKSVYVAAESSDAVTDFSRDTGTGALTDEGCLSGAASGCATNAVSGLKGAFGIAVSPDGESVYVTSLSPDNSLVRLERSSVGGALSYAECFTHQLALEVPCGTIHVQSGLYGLDGAERVATSPDGKNVYVAALSESALAVFGPTSGGGSRHTLTVEKAGTGSGTVTSSPNGIECGATCSHTYPDGTKVTLNAAANAGSAFSGWSGGGCSDNGACELTIASDTTVTATFVASSGGGNGGGGQPGGGPSPVPAPTPSPVSPGPSPSPLKCKKGFKRKIVHDKPRCVKHRHHKGKAGH